MRVRRLHQERGRVFEDPVILKQQGILSAPAQQHVHFGRRAAIDDVRGRFVLTITSNYNATRLWLDLSESSSVTTKG